jgi:hypothetical protein
MSWQSIETAPKETRVLGWCPYEGISFPTVMAVVMDETTNEWWPDTWEATDNPIQPTHWMPLPAPPESQP